LTIGGGIRDLQDSDGKSFSALEVAAEYFRSGADKVSIGSDAVYAVEEFLQKFPSLVHPLSSSVHTYPMNL